MASLLQASLLWASFYPIATAASDSSCAVPSLLQTAKDTLASDFQRATISRAPVGLAEGGNVTITELHEVRDPDLARDIASDAFESFDRDKSGELDAEELHRGIISETKLLQKEHNLTSNGSSAIVPMADVGLDLRAAQEMISNYDLDKSGKLNKVEFLAATAHGGKHESLTQTRGVDKCVSDIFGRVWSDNGCFREITWTECSGWRFFSCVGRVTKKGVESFGCWVSKVVDHALSSFADCFKQIIAAVKSEASGSMGGFMDFLPADCSSADSCWSKLSAGPQKLIDIVGNKVKEEASKILLDIPGVKETAHFAKAGLPVAKEAGTLVARAGKSMVNFLTSSGAEIAKYANSMPDLCTPDGVGFWYIVPTDCDAFASLRKIFTESFIVWKVKDHFDDTVRRFGRCIIKRGVLNLPSPFMDIKVQKFCLPQFIQKPIKGIVGSFRYMVSQIKAVATGCSGLNGGSTSVNKVSVTISGYATPVLQSTPIQCGAGEMVASQTIAYSDSCEPRDECRIEVNSECKVRVWQRDRCSSQRHRWGWSSYISSGSVSSGKCTIRVTPHSLSSGPQPICQLAKDISDIGSKIMGVFSGASLLQAAAEAATNSSSKGEVYRADCKGKDFSINLDLGLGVILPKPDGGMMKPFIFFQALSGCRKRKPFADIGFGLGLDRGVLGAPPEIKLEKFLKVGFNVGTPPGKVFAVGAAIKLALAIDLKSILGFDIAGVLGFPILPKISHPKGFTVVLKAATGLGLLEEKDAAGLDMSSRVQQAIDDTADYDEKVTAAYVAFANELAGMDIQTALHQTMPEPRALFQRGTAAAAEVAASGASPLKPNCLASLAFKFCLTCVPDVKANMRIPFLERSVKAPSVPGMTDLPEDYPSCKPGCMNGHNQKTGTMYKVNGRCYLAVDACWGCLNSPGSYPKSLVSMPCKSMWVYPGCTSQTPNCLNGGTHLRPGDIYRISRPGFSACYRALDNCYGCIGSPGRYPDSLRGDFCPDGGVTAYDYPACVSSTSCLSEGKYQRVGVTYKVSGVCYRATGGCWACLNNPAAHPAVLAPVPC